MSRLFECLAGLVFVAMFAWLPWFVGQSVLDAFALARDGIEKQVEIVALTGTQRKKLGGMSWIYLLKSEGRTFKRSFSDRQALGARVWMLELPQNPDVRMFGRRGDTGFKLLALDAGGYLGFWFLVAMALVFAVAVPFVGMAWLSIVRRPRWSEPF